MFDAILMDIWAEKYRPSDIDEMILPERLKNPFRKFIKLGSIPNMLLVSRSPGSGKTSVAKILEKALNCEMLIMNGGDKRKIDNIRNEVTQFVETASGLGKNKIVFIDEANELTPEALMSLKTFIEDHSEYVRFIFTTNSQYDFPPALLSRFQIIHFELESDEYEEMVNEFMSFIIKALKDMDIEYDEKSIFKIVMNSFPDYRAVWMDLQAIYNSYDKIDRHDGFDKKLTSELITAINSKDISVIRTFISGNPNINFKHVYTKLFNQLNEFKGFNSAKLIYIMADWNYKNNFVADKMLNFLGMCSDLLEN